ncbi:MAG TPA: hypothetical protein VE890_07185 [Thermoguttaceae bacterium]|nr:hypothetical protein [Thermoguttaceae bacterium]
MGFSDRWREGANPGNVGSIDLSGTHEACECRPLVFVRFLFVIIALPVAWVMAIPHVPLPLWQAAAAVIGGTLMYVALAYLINPQPDLENLGYLVGMVNDPCSYSDDQNRMLLQLQCVLGPGRFVAESLFDMKCFFQHDEENFAQPTEDTWHR